MDELKAQELYDFFNKEGYDLGDLDNFKSALRDEEKRMELYNFFNKEGYDVGDASNFILKKNDDSAVTSQNQPLDSEVTSQNQPLDSRGKQGQVNISLGSEKTQEDTASDSSTGTISFSDSENIQEDTDSDSSEKFNHPYLQYLADNIGVNVQETKSLRELNNSELEPITKEITRIEERYYNISKNSDYDYQELLQSDGSYSILKDKQKKLLEQNEILNKAVSEIAKDTNAKFSKDGKAFFSNILSTFGISENETENLEFNELVEDEIIKQLTSDDKLLQKTLRGYTNLEEKEDIIARAKQSAIQKKDRQVTSEIKSVMSSDLDDSEKVERLKILENDYNTFIGSIGIDKATGYLKNAFRRTEELSEFQEQFGDSSIGDATSTLIGGLANTVLDLTVGFIGDAMASVGDIFTDQDKYSSFDAFSDTLKNVTDYKFVPDSQKERKKIITEDGDFNINFETSLKSLSETLPFTLTLISQAKKGNVSNIERQFGKLLRPSKKMSQELKLAEDAFKITYSDNYEQGKEFGLNGIESLYYANGASIAEAVAQFIMPDTDFLGSSKGLTIKRLFSDNLKGQVKKESIKNASKSFFTNIVREVGEEEFTMASQDILASSLIGSNYNSQFLDMKSQKELLAATVLMSGTLGAFGVPNQISKNKKDLYNSIVENKDIINENISSILNDENISDDKKEKYREVSKFLTNLDKAISSSPSNASSKVIDLLIKKYNLEGEKGKLDDSFHKNVDEEIKNINEEIAETIGSEEGTAKKETANIETLEKERQEELEQKVGYIEHYKENEAEGEYEWQREQAREFNKDVKRGLEKLIELQEGLLEEAVKKGDSELIEFREEAISDIKEELRLYEEINAKYDSKYVDAVKKGEMTKEQAMQALEENGRKNSDAYAEIAALESKTEETVKQPATIEEDTGEIKSTPEATVNTPQKTLSAEARKVQLKERESAKNRLKALRDKKNKKASDIKEIKREAVRWIKSVLGVDDINLLKKSEFNTIIQQLRDVELDDKGNLKNPTDLNDIIKNLEDQVNKTRSRKAEKAIKKILGTKLKDKQGKALVSQEAIDVINQVKELLADEDVTIDILDVMEASREYSETFEEAMAIAKEMLYAKMEGNSAQDVADFLESAQERLDLVVGEGKLKIKELREADKQRKKENIKEARVDSSRKSREQLETIDKFKQLEKIQDDDTFMEKAFEFFHGIFIPKSETLDNFKDWGIDNVRTFVENSKKTFFESSNFNKQFKSKNVLLDKIFQAYRYISSDLDTLIDIVSKKMSNEFLGGYLHSKISDGVRIAEESYLNLTRKHKGVIHDKMMEIYSKGYSKFVNITGDVIDSVIVDTSQELPTGVYDSNGNEIILSRGRAMWLYNQYKNSKLHPNFERAGLTPEVMSKIVNDFLTKEDIQFADWLTNEYYPSVHSELNPVFKRLYFRNLPKIENYAGQIRYQGIDGVKSTDMLSDTGYKQDGATLFFGSGIDRVNNNKPIDTEQDVFSNLFRYTDSANRFISSAEIYRDIKEILNDDQVTDNFKRYNRGDIKFQIDRLIDLSFGFRDRKDDNIIINFLIGAKIVSSLALAPRIVVTQIISTTLWLGENSIGVMGNALKFMANPVQGVKYLREIYENSEYIRKRYNDSSFVKVEAAYVAQNRNYGNKYRAVRLGKKGKDLLFGKVALANVMFGDALGMFILGVPYYKTIKDAALIKFKGDEAKATKYAIQEFNKRASKNQQSYQSNDRDLAQHTDLGKVVNMYGNSPKQYHRNTFQAFLQIKRAMQGREHKGTVTNNIKKIVLNHMVQGALYQWVGTAMVGLLTEDDEEKSKLKDVVWGAVFGSWSKFFIIGDLAQAAWDNYQGKPYGENPQFTPITADYAKLFREINKHKKAVEKEDDIAIEETSAEMYRVLMDLVGIPANKAEGLYNNYKKILEGDYGSDEEMILRLLNYSQYAIDHMDEYSAAEREKEIRKKASETRKRRNRDSKKPTTGNQNQFQKLK